MDIKLTQSKINYLQARIEQFRSCGLFDINEQIRLTMPLESELSDLKHSINQANHTVQHGIY